MISVGIMQYCTLHGHTKAMFSAFVASIFDSVESGNDTICVKYVCQENAFLL